MAKALGRDHKVAGDLMTRKPFVIHTSMTVGEVAQLFLDQGYTSAPVVGNTGEILGIVDEFGLIKAKLVQHIEEQSRDKLAHHTEYLIPALTVRDDTPLTEVLKEMIKAPNHRLLVLNKAHALVGIISPKDILRYVVGVKPAKSADLKAELEGAKNDLRKLQSELKYTKGKLDIYKDIVMENPSMIHSVDADGKILMANKKMHKVLGYENNELLGKTIFDLYASAVHHEAVQGLKKIKDEGAHKNTLTTMMMKNGEKQRIDIVSAALNDETGNFIGTISVSRPVDSDILLRALHGVLKDDNFEKARYALISQFGGAPVTNKEAHVASDANASEKTKIYKAKK